MAVPKLRFKEFDGDWTLSELDDHIHESKASSKIQDEYEVLTSSRRGLIRQADYFENSRLTDRENIGFNIIEPDQITYRSRSDDGFFFFNLNGLGITGIISTYYPVFTMKKGNNWFLNELLNYHKYKYIQYAVGTSQLVLSLNQLRKIKFNIPCLDEQTKIASFLSAVDEKISQLTQKHELLSQYKQGMMQKLFSQQIRFKADDGSEFGEWETVKLGNLCLRNYQGINTVADKVEYQKVGYPILQAKHITSEKLDFEDARFLSDLDFDKYKDKYIPRPNDILFSNIGTIGKVVLVEESKPFFIAWNIFLISVKMNLIVPFYLATYLRWLTSLNYFDNLQTGNATKFINKTDLLDIKVNLPSLDEQTKIANFLSAIDQKIEVVAQQIEQAKTWKKGLLQQMFV